MKALIIVDLQKDFLPGGALAVPQGKEIIPVVNNLLNLPFTLRIGTKDWHPKNHYSFASSHNEKPGAKCYKSGYEQILWPDHCVQESWGAEFAQGWRTELLDQLFFKGTDPLVDSYSTFFDNMRLRSTQLHEYLTQHKITDVYLAGLATDYCVKYSAFDAKLLGYNTYVIADACRGVNLNKDDTDKALKDMADLGINLIESKNL